MSLPVRDAAPLEASYFSPGKPGPAVVIFRNCDRRRESLDEFATLLQHRGMHVVTYDYRRGLLPGKDWKQTRESDLEVAQNWLASRPHVDAKRVIAIGGSCGVALTLALAERFAAAVRAIVVLSGPASPAQHAFVRRTPGLPILGISSRGEGAARNIDDIVEASAHPQTRRVMLEGRLHGTEILDDSASAQLIIEWLVTQLGGTSADR